MRSKKIAEVLFIILFFGFLGAAAFSVLFLPRDEYSYYENRMLAAKPELSVESLASGEYFRGLDSWLSDHAGGRETLLKANTAAELIRCMWVANLDVFVMNDTVVTKSVLLPYNEPMSFTESGVRYGSGVFASNIAAARDAVESYGGEFIFVMVPCQDVFFADLYPDYLENRADYIAASRTALLAALERFGVTTIDMGEILLRDDIRDAAASRVDNHYTIQGAYLTYYEIMREINASRQKPLTVLEEGTYTMRELPNNYLGSRSRKLFNLSPIKERLSILTPNADVPFRRYDNGVESPASVYSMPSSDYENVLYSLYMGGDVAETLIDTGRDELPSVLVYGDSFTNAVECILWYGFDEMRSLDLRHYTDMSLRQYIETYKPDYVVLIRDYAQLASHDYNGGSIG